MKGEAPKAEVDSDTNRQYSGQRGQIGLSLFWIFIQVIKLFNTLFSTPSPSFCGQNNKKFHFVMLPFPHVHKIKSSTSFTTVYWSFQFHVFFRSHRSAVLSGVQHLRQEKTLSVKKNQNILFLFLFLKEYL